MSADALVRAPMIVWITIPSLFEPVPFVAVTDTSPIPTPAALAIAARYASATSCDEDHVANDIDDAFVENPTYVSVTGEREGDMDGVAVAEEEKMGGVVEVTLVDCWTLVATVSTDDSLLLPKTPFDNDAEDDTVWVQETLRVALGVSVGVPDIVIEAVPIAVNEPLAPGDKLDVGDELIVLVNDSVVVGEGLPVPESVPVGD